MPKALALQNKHHLTSFKGDFGYYILIAIILIPSYPILRAIMLKHAPVEMSNCYRIQGYGAVTALLSMLSPPLLSGWFHSGYQTWGE